jgi:hypothetical protein
MDPSASAEAAVIRYFNELNKASATGDTSSLAALQDPSCSCTDAVSSFGQVYASGGRIEGGQWHVTAPDAGLLPDGRADVAFSAEIGEAIAYNAAGEITAQQPAISGRYVALLRPQDDAWLVLDVDRL